MVKSILERKLIEIDDSLKTNYHKQNDLGVLSGISGISLFQFYYSKYSGSDVNIEFGIDIISKCIKSINNGYNYPTYCSGIAGLGWVFDHLEQEKFIEIDSDLLIPEVDDYLYQSMINDFKRKNYDFLHGGIGYAFYFLKRYNSTNSKKLKDKYQGILFEVIDLIRELSENESENKIKWLSVIDQKTGAEGYNLSLSHGMSSIIGILTKLYENKIFKDATKTLLEGAINYILSLKNQSKNNTCIFPSYIPKIGETKKTSRVAWCYGDLGIAIRLWFAAKALKDEALKTTAISIFKHSALRTKQEDTMVVDASICHGSFGNAQIFNRIYKETEIEDFKNAANFWIQNGINKAIHLDGYAGYKQFLAKENYWEPKTNLIEGITGIGLVIIDYLSDVDNHWDECLMIS